jgi:hypothetical protein
MIVVSGCGTVNLVGTDLRPGWNFSSLDGCTERVRRPGGQAVHKLWNFGGYNILGLWDGESEGPDGKKSCRPDRRNCHNQLF